ncbi:unnamed protein product [Arabis nemorensis]|uniref:Uncharacterized protein n=1 Tax=Arabis nemorensis TaxID=586526 RepID=A0A565BTX9_9BRAS|nr:unnamed protein product [Arabis nemorensis]
MMEKAIIADARNPLPKYYKANILISLGDYHKDCAPQESSVHGLFGRLDHPLTILLLYKHHIMQEKMETALEVLLRWEKQMKPEIQRD